MRTLYGLRQSPWTEKARWALDHHGVAHQYHEHVPLLGELLLRRKAGSLKTRASVPLLVDEHRVERNSLEIARYAERLGRGAPLFSRVLDPEIVRLDALSDQIIDVGRAAILRALRDDAAVRREAVPAFVPRGLTAPFASATRLAGEFLARKHGVSSDVDGQVERQLRPALTEVRRTLGGRAYLLGELSYADISVAAALQAVRPGDRPALGVATRRAWANDAVARDFEDLLAWRDALYARHR